MSVTVVEAIPAEIVMPPATPVIGVIIWGTVEAVATRRTTEATVRPELRRETVASVMLLTLGGNERFPVLCGAPTCDIDDVAMRLEAFEGTDVAAIWETGGGTGGAIRMVKPGAGCALGIEMDEDKGPCPLSLKPAALRRSAIFFFCSSFASSTFT